MEQTLSLIHILNRLPEDEVCYWDLIFTDGSNQSRDSSAAAIGVCGIHAVSYTHLDVYKRQAMSCPCWQDTAGAPDSSARLETTSMEGFFAGLSGKRESAAADL